jgi:RHS repeat-associated protein
MNGFVMRHLGAWLSCLLLVGMAMQVAQAATVEYIHTDALGSPVAVTNSAGAVVERREYEPYGRQLSPVAVADGPGFTGHVSDAATGLDYMQQRYYDPMIGRFLSVDPVSANRYRGSNFNRYWYANNNPYRFTDPDGRLAFDDEKDKPPPPPNPEDKPEPVTLGTVLVTATRPAPAPVSIPWGKIGGSLVRGGSIPLTFISGMWPYDMGYSPCEEQAPFACKRMYNEAQPNEPDLTKVKERDGNKVAQDAGYDDAHDAKKGRGEGGVDIYRDKSSGKHWLWNGVPGGDKEEL